MDLANALSVAARRIVMPYRLNKGVYAVRCRHPHCPFNTRLEIDQNIMGMTESDVENEAMNMARGMAMIKHDSLRALRQHSLTKPEIRKVAGYYEMIGVGPVSPAEARGQVVYRDFSKGEVIVRKGEEADTICEVVRGMAYPQNNKEHRYGAGDCFGAAALLAHQSRMMNIVSGSDRTRVAFYSFVEVSRRDPRKARVLYNRVLQDTFRVIRELEQTTARSP
jgi:hypothetical protein